MAALPLPRSHWRTLMVLSLSLAILGGCTDNSPESVDPVQSSTKAARSHRSAAANTCLTGTGHAMVSTGPLSMGPFDGAAQVIAETHKMKVWVGTRRRGVDGNAELVVTAPDHVTRRYSRDAASARGFESFYPGLIDVTEPGLWLIRAHVGEDRMCVEVKYR